MKPGRADDHVLAPTSLKFTAAKNVENLLEVLCNGLAVLLLAGRVEAGPTEVYEI